MCKILLPIIVVIGIYLIYKQKQIYFLKKYPPGTGKIVTQKNVSVFLGPVFKNVRYYRTIRESQPEKAVGIDILYYHGEYEIWE